MRHMTTIVQHPARKEIKPGMLLRTVLVKVPKRWEREDWVTPHDVRGGRAGAPVPMFALPKTDADAEPYGAYTPKQQVRVILAVDTDVEVLLASGQQVFSGTPLVSNGDGELVHWHAVPDAAQIIATALEDIDLTDLPARVIKARTRM